MNYFCKHFCLDDVKLSREQHHKKSFVLKLAFGETEVLLEVENQVRFHILECTITSHYEIAPTHFITHPRSFYVCA